MTILFDSIRIDSIRIVVLCRKQARNSFHKRTQHKQAAGRPAPGFIAWQSVEVVVWRGVVVAAQTPCVQKHRCLHTNERPNEYEYIYIYNPLVMNMRYVGETYCGKSMESQSLCVCVCIVYVSVLWQACCVALLRTASSSSSSWIRPPYDCPPRVGDACKAGLGQTLLHDTTPTHNTGSGAMEDSVRAFYSCCERLRTVMSRIELS